MPNLHLEHLNNKNVSLKDLHWSSSISFNTWESKTLRTDLGNNSLFHLPRDVPDQLCRQHLWKEFRYFCLSCRRCHSLQSHNLKVEKEEREGTMKLSLGFQKPQGHRATQNKARGITRSPNHWQPSWGGTGLSCWVKSIVVLGLYNAKTVLNSNLYITVLLVKF